MNIASRPKTLAFVISGILFVLVLLIIGASLNQKYLNTSQQVRYSSYQLSNELRQSSEDLTRLARTYVVTGEPSYEAQYWEIIAVRNGEKARPDGRKVALQALMKDLGFTQEEFAKLKEAESNSNGLVATETKAMNAVKGLFDDGTGKYTKQGSPDGELARRIMHDGKYHSDKALIAKPIVEFEKLLDARTDSIVETYVNRGNLFLGSIAGLLLIMAGAIAFTAYSIRQVLADLVSKLAATCARSTNATGTLVEMSQRLSSTATEQAAAIEETVATLEELSSTVKLNADNSKTASDLAEDGLKTARSGESEILELISAMEGMAKSSKKIEEIIQVIDDIAFQTNLLALNAAVEAARAGEQGKGFAVVAEAVRALAQRTAVAAKDVNSLIRETVEKSSAGAKMADKSGSVLKTIVESVSKVSSLNNEIAQGSREQANGIEQISKVINQFDSSMQINAGVAQKVAAGSEEISIEMGDVGSIVTELRKLVTKSDSREGFTNARYEQGRRGDTEYKGAA